MPRTNRPSRVDANQAEIVLAFRRMGCSVLHLHSVGHGCPDLLIGVHGRNKLVEIKSGNGKLTADEEDFRNTWRGQCVIIRTVNDAVALVEADYDTPKTRPHLEPEVDIEQ